jgi:hypothetical protein
MIHFKRGLAIAICSVALITTGGCNSGPPTGDVSGTVTMDGQPVTNAIVTFVPQNGGQNAIGKTDDSGKYELYRRGDRGALLGPHTVVITTVQEPSGPVEEISSDSDEYLKQATGGNRSDYDRAIVKEPIPARYNKQSTLNAEVVKGQNTFDFALTSN